MDSLSDSMLRELGRSYYEGLLSFDEYRDKRRLLIDKLTATMPPSAEMDGPAQSVDDAAHTVSHRLLWLVIVGLVALLGGWVIL